MHMMHLSFGRECETESSWQRPSTMSGMRRVSMTWKLVIRVFSVAEIYSIRFRYSSSIRMTAVS